MALRHPSVNLSPIPRVYILDLFLQPVPIGFSGEIYINSVGLARGYFLR